MIITAVISIRPYLADKGEHTVPYKINNDVYIKTSKIIHYMVMILYICIILICLFSQVCMMCVSARQTEFAVLTGRSVSCVSAMSMFEEGKVAKADAAENDSKQKWRFRLVPSLHV